MPENRRSYIAQNLIDQYSWLVAEGLDHPDHVIETFPDPETVIGGKRYISFCSNNYLGLSKYPEVVRAARETLETHGIGTCESRRLGGNLSLLEELEQTIARFKGTEDAILFGTGLMANVGVISAITDIDFYMKLFYNKENGKRVPIIISDERNHRSIQMGIKLAKSPCERYRHCDMDHLEALLKQHSDKNCFIITDSIFSMDGNLAHLDIITRLAEEYRAAVMIDDAHGSGVWGKTGRGVAEHFGVTGKIEFIMGTLSKAFGGLGGFMATLHPIVNMLKINTSTYYFTSSLPADEAAGLIESIRIVERRPQLRRSLWNNVHRFMKEMLLAGFQVPRRYSQIIPILVGDEYAALKIEKKLLEHGILCSLVGVPAVKRGEERIRVTINASHNFKHIDRLVESFRSIARELDMPLQPISTDEFKSIYNTVPDYIREMIRNE